MPRKTPRPLWRMVDDLAVHQRGRAHDRAAIDLADRLVAEADAEDRDFRAGALDQRQADAGLVGRAGAGREHDGLGVHGHHLVDGDLVVAAHGELRPQLADVVDEVVGEAVVVIDDENGHGLCCLILRARMQDWTQGGLDRGRAEFRAMFRQSAAVSCRPQGEALCRPSRRDCRATRGECISVAALMQSGTARDARHRLCRLRASRSSSRR